MPLMQIPDKSMGAKFMAGFLACLSIEESFAAPDPEQINGFPSCIATLKSDAVKAGVDQAIVGSALNDVLIDEQLLAAFESQPEFSTPIWDYFAFLVDEQRVEDGRAMLAEHDALLRGIESRFGVDRHVVTAVWGVESDYGRETGRHFLPHALGNLGCLASRRTTFWKNELITALKLVDRGDLALDKLYGSWAGAFGQTQFIPSTYARLAVDFDDYGRRDLVSSTADALASTANYLKAAGWRSGGLWMIEARAPADYDGPTGRTRRFSLSQWNERGIRRADGKQLHGDARAGLLLPAGPRGPAFLVFGNFDAIYAYNHAESYALAISHLADRLAGYPALRTPWPTEDPGLSRAERFELQRLLADAGYDVGEIDGKVGPMTRGAITTHERMLGWPETGRAGQKMLKSLREN